MQRSQWKFGWVASDLEHLAIARFDYHLGRVRYWTEQLVEADAAVKESVQVREHDVTGGKQMNISADPEKQSWYNTCSSKKAKHEEAAKGFKRWADVLHANADVMLDVDYDDLVYFGVSEEPESDDA